MAQLPVTKNKAAVSAFVESILTNTGGRIINASELQSLFDSLISYTHEANAKYAYKWNTQRLGSRAELCRLPDELLVHAFSYMELSDWLRVTLVSRHWHKLVITPAIWSKVIVRYPVKVAATTDEAKVAWLRTYLQKSAEASLDIEWQAHTINAAEIALLAANMHRTVHFNAPYIVQTGSGISTLLYNARRLETLSLGFSSDSRYVTAPNLRRVFKAPGAFNFEGAFGEELPSRLRRIHVGIFTLPPQSQVLPAVTDFEGMMRDEDDSNLKIFQIFPGITTAKLLFQRYPVFPTSFPVTLQTLRIGPCVATRVNDDQWEPLLDAATHPIRTVHFEHIGALHVPFVLFRRAVPREWKLVACQDTREVTNLFHDKYTRFTMIPASSDINAPCYSFYTVDFLWQLFICKPTGATYVAQNALLVSLQLTPPTFRALLKTSTNLPALRVFTLCAQEAADLPGWHDMPCGDDSPTAVKAAALAEFILQVDGYDCETAAKWFTRFMPSHIRHMFEYQRERLERVAFVGRFFDLEYNKEHAWSRVVRLAETVHVGISLDDEPLLVPGEDDNASEGEDWQLAAFAHIPSRYDEGDESCFSES